MRALGVGAVYWPQLAPVFEDAALVGVLELELQAFWEKLAAPDGARYLANDKLLSSVARLPQCKLLHGVAQPFGGATDDPLEYLPLWRSAVEMLQPAWVSEHLSFNRTLQGSQVEDTGFLLPPQQTAGGVAQAVRNIQRFGNEIARPVAFETGVNYLHPRAGELKDGEFFAAIAREANCGILLDLHNLWCNERNGRQRVSHALAQMPLERVWEVHLAGGMELNGFCLDAHSDVVPARLIDLAAEVLPKLPNLGALIFEILPEHAERIGLDAIQRQIETLHSLWRLLPPRRISVPSVIDYPATTRLMKTADSEAGAWDRALVDAIRHGHVYDSRFRDLAHDPGIDVFRILIADARRSNLARSMHYTITLLLVHLGSARTRELLDVYFRHQPADPFVAMEADGFARFLQERLPNLDDEVPCLAETCSFEHALIRAAIRSESTEVRWSVDPTALFDALDEGRKPVGLVKVQSTMHVQPQ
jgi:uncharacterized protein (UPF0276 family)